MRRQHKPLTDQQRYDRKIARMQPQQRQERAIRRALKRHQTPPTVSFGLTKPPVGTF